MRGALAALAVAARTPVSLQQHRDTWTFLHKSGSIGLGPGGTLNITFRCMVPAPAEGNTALVVVSQAQWKAWMQAWLRDKVLSLGGSDRRFNSYFVSSWREQLRCDGKATSRLYRSRWPWPEQYVVGLVNVDRFPITLGGSLELVQEDGSGIGYESRHLPEALYYVGWLELAGLAGYVAMLIRWRRRVSGLHAFYAFCLGAKCLNVQLQRAYTGSVKRSAAPAPKAPQALMYSSVRKLICRRILK
jgi:hypothetical protein